MTRWLAVVALAVGLSACGSAPRSSDDDGRLLVVTTTTQVSDFARNIGGDRVDVHPLLKAERRSARLRGVGRRPRRPRAGRRDRGERCRAGGLVRPRRCAAPSPTRLVRRCVDRRDGGASGDPHIWTDPANAEIMATNIADGVRRGRPGRRGRRTPRTSPRTPPSSTRSTPRSAPRSARLANKQLVTDHDSFGYYVDRYGLDYVGSVIPSFDSQAELSPTDVHDLVASIKAQGVKAIFTEASLPPKTAAAIAREAGVKVVAGDDGLYGDSLGPPGSDGDTYLKMMEHNTRAIVGPCAESKLAGMTFDNLGYYTLAGAAMSPRDLIQEAARRRAARPRLVVHLRAVQRQGGGDAVGRGGRGVDDAADRHGGDEPQHPPPAGHRRLRDDDAPPHRRPLHARPRAGHRPDDAAIGLKPVTTAQLEDFAGLMRRLWHGETIIGHDGPAGTLAVPAPRRDVRRGHPARHHRVRPEHAAPRRAGVRPGRAAHVLRGRDAGALRAHGQGGGRARRARPGLSQGVVVPGDDRRPPARAGAAEEDRRADGHLPAGLRRPDGRDERLGSRRRWPGSVPTRSSPGTRGRSTRRRRPPSSSTSPR